MIAGVDMRAEKRTVHIEVVPTEDGAFRAHCPEIEGISAVAATRDAASAILRDLITRHCENVVVVSGDSQD